VEAWCLGSIVLCVTAILAGASWLCRARGTRIVSGRPAAIRAYVWLFAAVAMVGLVGVILARLYPILSANLDGLSTLRPVCIAIPPVLLVGLIFTWRCARSLGRSVLFYNVRRDDLANAVAAALRQMGLAADHHLHTFSDEFVMPDARIVVHGAVNMSRLEWIGSDELARDRLVDLAVSKLTSDLAARGRQVIDERPDAVAVA
jgi:hypothetical protein